MNPFSKIADFYRISPAVEQKYDADSEQGKKLYRKYAMQSFCAATFGYSLYYVCRTSLNVMKKPILDSGMLDAEQLGMIGSALLLAYSVGKFVNGFIADHCNIRRFMATGLILSTLANFIMGLIGFSSSDMAASSMFVFVAFAIMWGVNGWAQSMGAPPAIISLSRWFPLAKRGTFYGFFSASHNFGEGLSFVFVGLLVATFSWQWGFLGAAIAGALGVVLVMFCMHDNPESKGLPSIEQISHEAPVKTKNQDTTAIQIQVLKTPAVWVLAFASAFMYISRYAMNSWGVLYMQEVKGYDIITASLIISINAWLGIAGTVFSGWMSDSMFHSNRNKPAFVSGILLSISFAMFIYGGSSYFVTVTSMVLFGIAIGVLISFLGGLMAIDIVPRKATGAALGVVGAVSYFAAAAQETISGMLINNNITQSVNEAGELVKTYDFSQAAIFWIGASVISFLLPILNWGKKVSQDA